MLLDSGPLGLATNPLGSEVATDPTPVRHPPVRIARSFA